MNRRDLFSKIGVWTALLVSSDVFLSNKTIGYRVVIVNKPIKFSTNTFDNASDFWQSHYDDFAAKLNMKFQQSGKLFNIQSFLIKGLSSVVLIKHYRSKEDHQEYVRLLSEYHKKTSFQHVAKSKALC